MTYRANLNTRPVVAHRVFHAAFDRVLIAVVFHVDEINDNQTRHIAQAQLAGQLISRLKVGF